MNGETRDIIEESRSTQPSIETATVLGREKDAKHEIKAALHLIKADDPENDYGADYLKVDLFDRWPDSAGHGEWKEAGVGRFFNGSIDGCEADLGAEIWNALDREMKIAIEKGGEEWRKAGGLEPGQRKENPPWK